MKKRVLFRCAPAALALVLVLAGCASTGRAPNYTEEVVSVPGSRNNQIPATLTIPSGDGPFPVVLIAHGHGGSRSENGGLDLIAGILADKGVASLRMDFAGCGDNTENFTTGNRMSFMAADVASCKEYLRTVPSVDMGRLGIFGYSMGGRIAAVAAGGDSAYKAVVFLAPAILPGAGDIYGFMQLANEAAFNALYAQARQAGSATYTNVFGSTQTLGVGWFDDMTRINPQTSFAPFQGSFLLITGSKDDIILTANARTIIGFATRAKEAKTLEIQGADHGYGIYSNEPNLTRMAANAAADFFLEALGASPAN